MLVKNWMSLNVITVDVEDTVQEAVRRMKEYEVKGLPVMEKGKLIGIVTERDLQAVYLFDAKSLKPHEFLYGIATVRVRKIMTPNPITVSLNLTLEEVAQIFFEYRISRAPVVDDFGRLLGMITQNDIFRLLVSFTGIPNKGIQFGLKMPAQPDSVQRVTDILHDYGFRVISLLSTFGEVRAKDPHIYIRVFEGDRERLSDTKEELSRIAEILYIVDHEEGKAGGSMQYAE